MKKFFLVIFEYSDNLFCTNIVRANVIEDVYEFYSQYRWFHAQSVNVCDIEAAINRGMPIIEM